MPFVGKSLADGQLPSGLGTLYTVPALTRAVIKQIDIVSATAIVQVVQLYIKRSGSSSRRVINVNDLNLNEAIHFGDEGESISLSAGDQIEGVTTTAASVDYTITGAEETP
jgi:hypothetical protein